MEDEEVFIIWVFGYLWQTPQRCFRFAHFNFPLIECQNDMYEEAKFIAISFS